jgi:methicillin resistance protein
MYIKEMSNALEEYHAFMETQANRTVFQTPEWGEVKTDGSWTRDVLLVMSDNHEPVAAAMILYRKLPGVNKYLAYAPRGIVTDYTNAEQLKSVFATLKVYLKI